ncbi:MAG: malonyl-CoA synthase [Betaproteobacteria bacterium]|jgi:malonyl-CoA/methylmalonyl-CoA synthetase|nr:MAG: malonyl-CoA synthase [Betaproteobacteria bacterium]
MSNSNMYLEIARAVANGPDRIAIETEDGASFTYGELHREVARMANALLEVGLQPGDRVAAQLHKSVASLFVYLACLRAGLVYLPLNTAYQSSELDYFLRDAEPGLILVEPDNADAVTALSKASVGAPVMTLAEDKDSGLAQRVAEASARFDTRLCAASDLAVIIYTSGTTGRSKGAMVTHGNLVSNARALTQVWRFNNDDVLLHTLPIFHVHGLFVATHCALTSGARMLWHDRFDAAAVVRQLKRASVFMGVPTYYTRLLGEPGLSPQSCRGMRLFISGSAPLLAETHSKFEQRSGHRILERYGMSEAGMITSNPYDGERRAGTVGFALPGVEVRVVDDTDQVLPVGEKGAIQIKGENVFSGYWRMLEKTKQEFTADGWFRTGDIGVFDRDGYLSIVGRAKDLIITGGYNVYPKEIELALDELQQVVESAVIGVRHADYGEAVTGIVVLREGAEADEANIIATLKSKLAGYKVPKRVHFVEGLPRNAMGKVQKNLLRERFG